jgi:hypothetical protein
MKRILLALLLALLAPGAIAAEIILFEHDNFGGRRFVLNGSLPDLANTDFNDAASSIVVRSGSWQLCEHAFFRGRCITLAPGEYPSLNRFGLNDEVSSVREVGPAPAYREGRSGPDWGGGARAVLYEGTAFTGRAFVIEGDVVRNLGTTGFNDRASSLRVEGGYWVFCSDANFEGACRTFAPGDYPNLPPDLDNRISSGRRIHGEYPYRQAPEWSRSR